MGPRTRADVHTCTCLSRCVALFPPSPIAHTLQPTTHLVDERQERRRGDGLALPTTTHTRVQTHTYIHPHTEREAETQKERELRTSSISGNDTDGHTPHTYLVNQREEGRSGDGLALGEDAEDGVVAHRDPPLVVLVPVD